MLNANVEIPVLAGDASTLTKRIRQDAHRPADVPNAGAGRPSDVELAPYYRLAHERYNLYWKVVPS